MKRAAVFDLDGTVISGISSERRFVRHLVRTGEIGMVDIFRSIFKPFRNYIQSNRMLWLNKYYLEGKSLKSLILIANDFFIPQVDKLVPEKMKKIIQTHREKDDLLIIISGTLSFILDIFSKSLSFDGRRGTELEIEDGKCTGAILGIHPSNEGKALILDEFSNRHNIDLLNSTAYGNHYGDRFYLEKTGNPVAVNPDKKLFKYAQSKKWEILEIR